MKWFAKMGFDGGESSKHKQYFVKSDDNVFRRSIIISFFVLGIPVFVELFLILNYPEPNFRLLAYPPYYTVAKVAGLLVNFSLSYILFISVRSKLMRKISITLWLLILHIPANLDFICARVTGTLLSNDFMFAIFNTHLREAILIIKEYSVFICVNLLIIFCAFCLKSDKRYMPRYS